MYRNLKVTFVIELSTIYFLHAVIKTGINMVEARVVVVMEDTTAIETMEVTIAIRGKTCRCICICSSYLKIYILEL